MVNYIFYHFLHTKVDFYLVFSLNISFILLTFDSTKLIFLVECSILKVQVQTMRYNIMKIRIKCASTGNQTRIARVAGEHSTDAYIKLSRVTCIISFYMQIEQV